jgi:hypothetical protein
MQQPSKTGIWNYVVSPFMANPTFQIIDPEEPLAQSDVKPRYGIVVKDIISIETTSVDRANIQTSCSNTYAGSCTGDIYLELIPLFSIAPTFDATWMTPIAFNCGYPSPVEDSDIAYRGCGGASDAEMANWGIQDVSVDPILDIVNPALVKCVFDISPADCLPLIHFTHRCLRTLANYVDRNSYTYSIDLLPRDFMWAPGIPFNDKTRLLCAPGTNIPYVLWLIGRTSGLRFYNENMEPQQPVHIDVIPSTIGTVPRVQHLLGQLSNPVIGK